MAGSIFKGHQEKELYGKLPTVKNKYTIKFMRIVLKEISEMNEFRIIMRELKIGHFFRFHFLHIMSENSIEI